MGTGRLMNVVGHCGVLGWGCGHLGSVWAFGGFILLIVPRRDFVVVLIVFQKYAIKHTYLVMYACCVGLYLYLS